MEIREARLRELARQRLALFPDGARMFFRDTIDGERVHPVFLLLAGIPITDTARDVMGTFDEQAIRLIDEWAAANLEKPVQPLVLAARPPSPAKTNAAPQPPKRKRADLLTPVIERAQAQANDPTNHSEVFAILRTWATSNDKPAPVIGYAESDGMQWLDGSDKVRWLNLAALRKRINRPPVAAKGR